MADNKIDFNKNEFTISFRYNEYILTEIKEFRDKNNQPLARYNPDYKTWILPHSEAAIIFLKEFIDKWEFQASTSAEIAITEACKYAAGFIYRKDNRLCVKTDRDQQVVRRLRSIPGAKWDEKLLAWAFSINSLAHLKYAFPNFQIDASITSHEVLKKKQIETLFQHVGDLNGSYNQLETLLKHQKEGVIFMLKKHKMILADDMGLGKAQPLTAKVLTPNGWTTMGSLKVGDQVVGSKGETINVTGVFPQGEKMIFRVTFSDGSHTECSDDHLWMVMDRPHQKYHQYAKVVPLKELIGNLQDAKGKDKWHIPLVQPIKLPKQDIKINAYKLTFHKEENDWLAGFEISHEYLWNDHRIRLLLLQGILDALGYANNRQGVILETRSKRLALTVTYLVQSLGGVILFSHTEPSDHYIRNTRTNSQDPVIQLKVRLPHYLSYSKRKKNNQSLVNKTEFFPTRSIRKIEYVGKAPAQCISVDSQDHLYVTNDFILTHNTITTGIVARAWQKAYKTSVLVVCPKSLKKNWVSESERVGTSVQVTSYGKVFEDPKQNFILVADEAHALCNPNSQRTKKVKALAKNNHCKAVYLLTGSPIKNGKPANLFPLLDIIDHPLSHNKAKFEKYFCKAHANSFTQWDTSGADNLEELYRLTKSSILRRRLEECIDLPPQTRIQRPVELSAKVLSIYNNTLRRLKADYHDRINKGIISSEGHSIVAWTHIRQAASLAKVEEAVSIAEELLEQGRNPVIFTNFRESCHEINNRLTKLGYKGRPFTGETSETDRDMIKDSFQRGDLDFFCATVGAGGTGLTLTRSDVMILVDRPWTPADTRQAEKRIHRITQNKAVTIIWLVINEADDVVHKILESKDDNIDIMLNGKKIRFNKNMTRQEIADRILPSLWQPLAA